ncbi:MAG: hypothetical protein Q8N69_01380, partial [bacterium]|nr:hypothetical protein [bacterium]
KSIKDGIKSEKDFDSAKKARSEALEKISEASKVEILEVLVQRESEKMLEDFKHDVSHRMGMPFEEYLKKINKTEEDLKKMIIPEAEKKVKNYLILQEIGKKEGVFVSEEEVEDETNKALEYYAGQGRKIDPNQLKDYTKEAVKTEKIYKIIDGLISK